MRANILKSFFSSGLQAVSVQILGVIFLGIAAYYLSESDFGVISWVNALSMFIMSVLSFGMEQVVVRRIAASDTSDWSASAFFIHALVGSLIASIIIFIISDNCKDCKEGIRYLPLFFTAQCFLFLVVPLKQFLNAKHLFAPYGVIAFLSNIIKISSSIWLINKELLSVTYVAYILIATAAFELLLLLLYVKLKTGFSFSFKLKAYKKLIKESAPQYLSIIFDSSLSRLDWILLGIIGSYAATGGYSFAYRAYELARLPIVIIAPVILNIFARLFVTGKQLTQDKKNDIINIYRIEIFISVIIPLVLNIIWSPLLDEFFNYKYGTSNASEFLMLSVCIPLHFAINLMWTILFSAKKYKQVARITMIIAIINLILNLVLIPLYNGLGAAISYFVTTFVQLGLLYMLTAKHIIQLPLINMALLIICGMACYSLSLFTNMHFLAELLITTVLYIFLCFTLRLVTIGNFKTLFLYLKK